MVDYRPLWTGTWHLRLLRADGSSREVDMIDET
jgi:hypothetical protein